MGKNQDVPITSKIFLVSCVTFPEETQANIYSLQIGNPQQTKDKNEGQFGKPVPSQGYLEAYE